MKYLRDALNRSMRVENELRFPVIWPEHDRATLVRLLNKEVSPKIALDAELARPLLECADGLFDKAEHEILRILAANIDLCQRNREVLVSLMQALFVVQRLDLVIAILKDKFEFATGFD